MPVLKTKTTEKIQNKNKPRSKNKRNAKNKKTANPMFFIPAFVILMMAVIFGSLGNTNKNQANAYEIGGVFNSEKASSNGLIIDINFAIENGSFDEQAPQKITNLVNKQSIGVVGSSENVDDSDPVYDVNGFFTFDGEKQFISLDGKYAPKNDFTFEAWVRADSSGKPEYVFASDDKENEKATAGIKLKDRYWWFMGFNDKNKVYIPYPDKNIDDDWHHIAVTRKDETLTIYVDGQPAEVTRGVNKFNLSNDYLTIGATKKGDDYDEFFKGDVSQIRVYARSLSDNEIITNIKNTKPNFIKSTFLN